MTCKLYKVYFDEKFVCEVRAVCPNQGKIKVMLDAQNVSPKIGTFINYKSRKDLRLRLTVKAIKN